MKERPIIFSGPMVRALLDGNKTQTRRVVKMKPHHQIEERDNGTPWPWMYDGERDADSWMACPYGQPGDRLWVRETYYLTDNGDEEYAVYAADSDAVREHLASLDQLPPSFPADVKYRHRKLRPSIHMPRWACRITLEITSVRVERLQDISFADAAAEGLQYTSERLDRWSADGSSWHATPQQAYRALWEQIHGPGSWPANPWVWVLEFNRFQK